MPSLYIDGKWTSGSGGSADVVNPFDASVVEFANALKEAVGAPPEEEKSGLFGKIKSMFGREVRD